MFVIEGFVELQSGQRNHQNCLQGKELIAAARLSVLFFGAFKKGAFPSWSMGCPP